MRVWVRPVVVGAAVVGLLVAGVAAWGQTAPAQRDCKIVDENGNTIVWPDCKPPADDKGSATATPDPNAAKKFPFPGEPAAPAAAGTTPAAGGTPVAPGASGSTTAGPADKSALPPSKAFPFPGETPDAPAAAPAPAGAGGGLQDAGSSGSSSSSSSDGGLDGLPAESGSAGPLGDDDPAARAAAERKAARHKLPPVARQSPDEREQEDLSVASFYMNDKNYRGAYLRATDAVEVAADDAQAHFALAEAARRLGKLDEAMVHYKKCLTLDPVPTTKKAAEKALKEMAGG